MICFTDGSVPRNQNTKRNMKAFGSRADALPAALWFDKQFPPFVDFDQESECNHIRLIYISLTDCFLFSPDLRRAFSPLRVFERRFRQHSLAASFQETRRSQKC